MEIRNPGHEYALLDTDGVGKQIVQFVEKAQKVKDGPLELIKDGTTNKEVLQMLIDRYRFLQEKLPCRESAVVLTRLEEALMWDNKRTEDRTARGVEGTNAK